VGSIVVTPEILGNKSCERSIFKRKVTGNVCSPTSTMLSNHTTGKRKILWDASPASQLPEGLGFENDFVFSVEPTDPSRKKVASRGKFRERDGRYWTRTEERGKRRGRGQRESFGASSCFCQRKTSGMGVFSEFCSPPDVLARRGD
jgi:hypothetical protein